MIRVWLVHGTAQLVVQFDDGDDLVYDLMTLDALQVARMQAQADLGVGKVEKLRFALREHRRRTEWSVLPRKMRDEVGQ